MNVLMLSDLSSGIAMAASTYIHHERGAAKLASYNVVSSIAGRFVSGWLSGGSIDNYTAKLITPEIKNYLVVYLVRYLLGLAMKEGNLMVRSFDTTVNDVLGTELLKALGIADRSLLGGVPAGGAAGS